MVLKTIGIAFIFLFFLKNQIFSQINSSDSTQIEQLKTNITNAKHDTTRINNLVKWSDLIYISDPLLNVDLNQRIIALSKKNLESKKLSPKEMYVFKYQLAHAYNGLGNYYASKGEYVVAISYYDLSIPIRKQIKDNEGLANLLNNSGIVYRRMGYLSRSVNVLNKCLKIRESIHDNNGKAKALNNLGRVYMEMGNLEKAIRVYKQSLKIKLSAKGNTPDHFVDLASSYENIGDLYKKKQRFEDACNSYLKGLSFHKLAGNNEGQAICLFNIGLTYYDKAISLKKLNNQTEVGKSILQALEYFKKAKSVLSKTRNTLIECSIEMAIGTIYFEKVQLDNAIASFHNSLLMAEKLNDLKLMASINEWLYKSYKKIGNQSRALLNFEQYVQLNDSLTKIASKEELLKLDIQSEFNQKAAIDSIRNADQRKIFQLAIDRQEAIVEKGKIELINKERQLYMFVFCITLLLFFIFYGFKKYKTEQKQKKLLQEQKEVTERLNTLNQKIFSVIAHDFKGPLITLSALVDLLLDNRDKELDVEFYTNDVKNQIIQTNNILENLLNWAKIELNFESTGEQNSIHSIVNEVIREFELAANKKSIKISNIVDTSFTYTAPADVLKIVLRNLLSNAIKFSYENGDIIIGLDENRAVYVMDYGMGMQQEGPDLLFNGKIKSSFGTYNETGFGLGLYITSELINKFRGNISIKKNEPNGSLFIFSFPS